MDKLRQFLSSKWGLALVAALLAALTVIVPGAVDEVRRLLALLQGAQ